MAANPAVAAIAGRRSTAARRSDNSEGRLYRIAMCGIAASSRRGGLADWRTQELGGKEILPCQPACHDRSAHFSRHHQSTMDLRTSSSAVEDSVLITSRDHPGKAFIAT